MKIIIDHGQIFATVSQPANVNELLVEHDNPIFSEECPICYEILEKKVISKCCHSFHKNCIRRWCRKNNNCPICRTKKPFE